MNTEPCKHNPADPLWDLLGKARPVEVSPYFARNVLREVRLAQARRPAEPALGLASLLLKRWKIILAGCAALCVVAATSTVFFQDHKNTLVLRSGDVEVICNLDEFLASEDSALWLKKTVY
jgi:hypothetical protein